VKRLLLFLAAVTPVGFLAYIVGWEIGYSKAMADYDKAVAEHDE